MASAVSPPVRPPTVRLHAAVVLTGRFPALAGVDLTVDAGEVVLVDGPNGAGKTTLLRLCAGLLGLTGGEGWVLGCDLRVDQALVRRRVGLFGHAAALYDDLTVTENVRFAVRATGAPADGVDSALERVGLTGRLRRTAAGRLSAGQRRRASLAALIARRPELWLLDEPHAALDADARVLLSEIVFEAADGGAGVLITSHDPHLAEPLASHAVSMAGGRMVAERRLGRPVEDHPSDGRADGGRIVAMPTGSVHVA